MQNTMRAEVYTGANGELQARVIIDRPLNDLLPETSLFCNLEGSQFHYGENDLGIINFGILHDDLDRRPGHSGMWSSRASVAQEITGVQIINILLMPREGYLMASHMKKEILEALLADTEYRLVYGKSSQFSDIAWFVSPKHGCSKCEAVLGDYEHVEGICRKCVKGGGEYDHL